MTRILFYFILAIAVSVVAVWFANHPGAVTLEWLGLVVEAPVAIVILLLIVLMIAAALLYRLWCWLRGVPGVMKSGFAARGQRRGQGALTRGLIMAAAGDGAGAAARARAAAKHIAADDSLLMLLNARVGELAGEDEAVQTALHAMGDHEETELLGLLGLIREARVRGEAGDLLELGRRARDLDPKGAGTLTLLFELHLGAADWDGATQALAALARLRTVTKKQAARARAHLLVNQAMAVQTIDRAAASALAHKAHKADTGHIAAAVIAAGLARAEGQTGRAAAVLEAAWARQPHPDLAAAYAPLLEDQTATEGMAAIEKLTAPDRDHFESRIVLAGQALAAGLLGLARDHLTALLEAAPPARACRLAAALARAEGGGEDDARRWELEAALAPEGGWECVRCRRRWAEWALRCAHCHGLASLAWRLGPARARHGEGHALAVAKKRIAPVVAAAAPGSDLYQALAAGEALDAAERADGDEDDEPEVTGA